MPVKQSIRRPVLITVAVIVFMLLAGMGFVTYFMHAVYEVDEMLSSEELPVPVRSRFDEQYPDAADVAWERDEGFYLAVFPWGEHEELEVYYRPDGAWEKTEQAILFSDLPASAQRYLKSRKGYRVNDMERIAYHDGRTTYEVEIAGWLKEMDCVFDAEGNLLTLVRDGSTLESQPGEE